MESKYVSHPLIRPETVEERLYQQKILNTCLEHNTLVILPTALGKTVVSLLVTAHRLSIHPLKKILILAPTRPLVLQHHDSFRRFLLIDNFEVLTGKVEPKKRVELWKNAQIVFATPQLIRNDAVGGRYDFGDVCLIVFDEAHRARKKYAYNQIAEMYVDQCIDPRILALTASPGQDRTVIKETYDSLFINAIEYRSKEDDDVKPYIHPLKMSWQKVKLPKEYEEVRGVLEGMLNSEIKKLQSMGMLTYKKTKYISKRDLLILGQRLRANLNRDKRQGSVYTAIILQAASISLSHAIEVLTTQDIEVLHKFLKSIQDKDKRDVKFARRITRLHGFSVLMELVKKYLNIDHPKQEKLRQAIMSELSQNPKSKIIVFTQFRDTATKIIHSLKEIELARPIRFVGQASKQHDPGLTQDEQSHILREFQSGIYNVLVATSIAEEGLDIPSVDFVIFYEPVPSEIRLIQRMGRTARRGFGRVKILITEGTADETYYWASVAKEKRMRKIVASLSEELVGSGVAPQKQSFLGKF
ncbi:MAG: helicase-related protein [Methanocellales archaeon]|nr:helicase-related protein [Methanocellales archaeon]MDD4897939.1 helicase-related protein [Methanocellales archaeon]